MAPAPHRPKQVLLAAGAVLALACATSLAAAGRPDPEAPAPVTIAVEARRWWWDVRYPDEGSGAVSANELHLPFGAPVRLVLDARDAIHGFWVPGLVEKIDLVPGKRREVTLRVEHPGVYRGQCSEPCGEGHARMTFVVVVEDAASFRSWLEAQRAPAADAFADADAGGGDARRGRDVFQAASCVYCHAVRGTPAAGAHGPDLTHVATRRTLRAGALPRASGHVREWLGRPLAGPAGTVPASTAPPADLYALVAYLETLR